MVHSRKNVKTGSFLWYFATTAAQHRLQRLSVVTNDLSF